MRRQATRVGQDQRHDDERDGRGGERPPGADPRAPLAVDTVVGLQCRAGNQATSRLVVQRSRKGTGDMEANLREEKPERGRTAATAATGRRGPPSPDLAPTRRARGYKRGKPEDREPTPERKPPLEPDVEEEGSGEARGDMEAGSEEVVGEEEAGEEEGAGAGGLGPLSALRADDDLTGRFLPAGEAPDQFVDARNWFGESFDAGGKPCRLILEGGGIAMKHKPKGRFLDVADEATAVAILAYVKAQVGAAPGTYCQAGIERSAFAVFATLYAAGNKDTLLESLMMASPNPKQTQRVLTTNSWWSKLT